MHCGKHGSTGADRASESSPRRRRTTRRRSLITCCALTAALAVLPASAYADPGLSKQELQSKIDRLGNKAEVVTEKYNTQRLQLKKAKKEARQAEQHAKRVERRLNQAHAAVAQLAAMQYKSGGARGSVSLFAAKDPKELIDRATMLAHLSQQNAGRLQDLRRAVEQAKHAEHQSQRAADKVKGITTDLHAKKKRVEDLVAQAKDKLAELEEQSQVSDSSSAPVDVGDVGSGAAARALEIALAQQGDPYVWAAEGPDAFDCSGLVVYAYGQVGVGLPHSTSALWGAGPHVSRSQLQPGDLVFTSSHHVGLYVGNGQFVNAPNTGEVVQVEPISSFYGAVRVT